jgi:hypothetical protein
MEELDLASHPELTALQGTTGVVFRSTPAGTFRDWHTAPWRQYVITLAGAAAIGLRDGAIHRLGRGDVNMAEDLTGHGHTVRVVGQVPRVTATIHMEPSQRARVDRPVRPVRTKDRFLDHRPVRFNTCTETARDRDHRDIGLFFESDSYVSTMALLTRIVIRQRQKEVLMPEGHLGVQSHKDARTYRLPWHLRQGSGEGRRLSERSFSLSPSDSTHMDRYAVTVSAHVFARTEHCLKGPLRHLNWGITLSVRIRMVVITTSRGTDDVQLTSNMISSVLKSSRSI